MKKVIKINVELEKQFLIGFDGKFEVNQTLFTDYETLFSYEDLAENVKKAISKLNGFDMLTVTLSIREDNDYSAYGEKAELSYRFTSNNIGYKMAKLINTHYTNWNECNIKKVYEILKETVLTGNRRFVELVKEIIAV